MNRLMMNGISKTAIVAYGAAINLGSFGLFYYDKQQALYRRWRVPEKTLQLSALMGGWLGGMLAIDMFRHKTKKEPFRSIYRACILGNIVGVSALAYLSKRHPAAALKLQLPPSVLKKGQASKHVYNRKRHGK